MVKETNDDADGYAKANKINDKSKDMVVAMKEEKNNFEYQENMNVDIETLPVKKNNSDIYI